MARRAIIALGILLAWCACTFALDPALEVSQYAHTAWTIREGFFKGVISSYSIAQTPDGYLWLGTESGLLRFDGVRSVPWQPPAGEHLPGGSIRSLLAARDGTLWIGTTEGLASWKDGRLMHYSELAGQVRPLLEDREGTIWAGGFVGSTGRLCAIQSGGAHCYGEDGSFGREVISLYEDSRGYLWAGAVTGLWRWKPGPPKLYSMPDRVRALMEVDNSALLIVMRDGIRQLVDGKAEAYLLPVAGRLLQPTRLLRDRNGGLWIGTADRGILHVHQGRADLFTRSNGLSGDFIQGLFEDREGNIWVATSGGLDRFRDFAIPTISVKQGLSNAFVWSVLAARDGSVWLGARDGLNRWNDGQITIYRKRNSGLPDDSVESIFEDYRGRIWVSTGRGVAYFENGRFTPVSDVPAGQVHSIAEDSAGSLWISHVSEGLFHLIRGRVVERIPWARLGRTEDPRVLLPDPMQGGLWLGFGSGVAYFKDGQVRASYGAADGLGEGRVTGLQLDRDGTLWAATEGGLSRVKNGRVATLTRKNGLPCDAVHWVMEDDDHSFWLYTACGLVRIARPELDGWAADPKRTIGTTVFDSSDGASSHSLPLYSPRVAKSSDGKIWFLPLEGVSVIDPRHLSINKIPPPVHVEEIIADDKAYDTSSGLRWRLPPLVHHVEIGYTALSFVAPEKALFRFKLEGLDRDWRDVGNRRRAFYTNLSPGNYRFRVAASNNSGVWNEAGAFLDFSIGPAYYQTTWFRSSCVASLAVLLWMAYRMRVHSILQRSEQLAVINAKLEAQIAERKQAEEALRRAQADLTHANRVSSMGELTASLAHEVKQPLAAAITDANTCLRWLARDQPDLEKARAAASRIVQDGRRASEIVNRVRLLFQKGTLQRELVDLNEVIREMMLLLHSEATKLAVLVRTELAADLPQVMGDRVQLQQVLVNLMMNSIDAMKDVDGTRELTINSQRGENEQLVVSVSDTGVGLPPEQAGQIFNAFFTTKPHGTGMGLRISRSIVESHGGRLWAADNSPRGARFCFTLPTKAETRAAVVSEDRT
jgi:signal transduction histidine kinase/ligand-binding sensor domain-containing protein